MGDLDCNQFPFGYSKYKEIAGENNLSTIVY